MGQLELQFDTQTSNVIQLLNSNNWLALVRKIYDEDFISLHNYCLDIANYMNCNYNMRLTISKTMILQHLKFAHYSKGILYKYLIFEDYAKTAQIILNVMDERFSILK